MTFSLITATLGRVDEIRRLCDSLTHQTFKDFELYIVDQNSHQLVKNIANEYSSKFLIHYIRNNRKGLSINRNIALKLASGEIFGFPDDDCYYAPDTLLNVHNILCENPEALFAAISTFDTTKKLQRTTTKKRIYKKDVLRTCISYNIFVRHNNILFDERLGVGTDFSSGEETDYLYSLIKNPNDYGVFCSKASVYHPKMNNGSISLDKIYNYSLGFAALQKKDWLYRGNDNAIIIFLYYLLRAFCGMLLIRNFKAHWKSFSGKISGFFRFKV